MSSFALSLRIFSVGCMILGSMLSYGFVLCKFGFIWGCIAAILFPVTVYVAPWYEGFVGGNWLALILVYGGAIATCIFGAIEDKLK